MRRASLHRAAAPCAPRRGGPATDPGPRVVGAHVAARAVAAACLAAVLGGLAGARPAHAEGRNFTGQMAPEIYVQQGLFGLPTGATLHSLRGRPIVLKFFFTRCGACRDTLPDLERQFRVYGRRVQFIAVAFDNRPAVEAMWRRSGFTMPVAIDEHGVTPQRYGIVTYPTAYLIGADGVVRSYDMITDGMLEREAQRASAMFAQPTALTGAPSNATAGTTPGAGAGGAARVTPAVGGAGPAAVPAGTDLALRPAAAPPVDAGERNISELGEVPSALAGAKELARRNDYGGVLRLVEGHFDETVHAAEVVAAAHRIERIAIERSERRKQRIRDRWALGDPAGAYEMLLSMVEDFRATTLERPLREWSERVRADLASRGQLAGR